ncbi:unnamed protein product [Penicillium salamii]|uniref:Helicase ATP-binding domain-containing protein n=1 Tax=Penicillium salamii TaxID=1612424 RepID=A0A9W4NF74_9EURO|nr:unnamed protein product [Penicillium salamii]CAG8358459.1 unnamed protein product [Penicillium salamii]CAG8373678.1 unnamed protein product [Penicillium salamii]CAG8376806.1 unnamed protein product [Penicillium salamii]
MAPTLASDPVSQADTPMTDVNDDTVPSVPVDSADAPMTDSDTNPNTTASSVAGDTADARRRRSEANNLRKSILGKKHGNLDSTKEDDSIRRFRYLLGLTDLFRHFIETNPNPQIKEIMAEIDRQNEESEEKNRKGSKRSGGAGGERRRRTEQEEDAELLQDEKHGGETTTIFRESPAFIHGELRDYQVAGLNWLVSLHENGISGILADEMGLGKTLQTISFLGYLRYICDIKGPHLVVVPKSTLDNWKREFARWTPDIDVLVLQGNKDERQQLINERLLQDEFDVCITIHHHR